MKEPSQNRESFLPRLSVRRPVSILMIFCAVLMVGAISYHKLPISLFPAGFDPPFLWVWVSYRTSNPSEVEEQITRPMEQQFRTVRHLEEIYSFSRSNGAGFWLEFEKNTDMDVAYNQIYDRLERARAEMPEDQRYYYINRFSDDDESVVYFAVNLKSSQDDVYYLMEECVQKPLERLEGIAKVEIWGAYQKVIQIELDAARAQAHDVNLYELVNNLQEDNFALSSGWVMDAGKKLYVRSIGRYKTIEEISKIPVKGSNILLGHVADVSYSVPERRWFRRLNREPAVSIGVFKESTANTVGICNEIVQTIDDKIKNDPRLKGAAFEILFNQGDHILEAVGNLRTAGLWGAFFAFWVLFFFLRHWRMTMIVILAIPLSLLGTIIFLYFYGWSLNLMTLMGLMICVGLVVDNAIVITESIFLARTKGELPDRAAIRGAGEVALAVTTATLTTVVVFLPLMFMNDDIGFTFYIQRIGMPVVVAILSSLVIALLIIPLATKVLIKSSHPMESSKLIEKLSIKYRRALQWVMNHKFDSALIGFLIFIFSQTIIAGMVPKTDMAEGNINDFRLRFDIPENYTLEKTEKIVRTAEELLFQKAKEYDLRAVDSHYSRTWASVHAYLNPSRDLIWWRVAAKSIGEILGIWPQGPMDRQAVIDEMKERMPKIPGVEMRTSWRRESSSESVVELTVYGDDTRTLIELAEGFKRHFKSLPNVTGVELETDDGSDEVQVTLNRELAQRYNLNPSYIAGTISYALRGYDLADFQAPDREIPMRTQLAKSDRETLEQLKNLPFYSQSGVPLPLASAADFKITKGLGEISRHNGQTNLEIKIFTSEDHLETLSERLDAIMANVQLPRGYSIEKGRRFQDMDESNQAQQFGIIMAIVFVFLLMGVLFESFVMPLSVIISIPFSFTGVYWILFLTGTPMDLMAGIGLIILIGIVVNNAIVLVDLINHLRKDGFSRIDAILEAGQRRFRPILMTALTTICGLLPMAMGNAALIGIPYAPLGRTIIGGLISATFMTLFMVPIAYAYFDELRVFSGDFLAKFFRKKEQRA
ncbi:hypothetical protein CEE37_09075 [candidate division LCP-89 bacterium B3_LCP]|uniref:Acriflavin resistance protein n=1 Tax=candidate division LCP-89 bacterium B3_LCP TaxID=2012998 RepID=A0A532UZR7_UNCL8|nr:MAG: hypothetical protein CEE37_09075 [candidate division LCP-89 bacterium B3_LCP]